MPIGAGRTLLVSARTGTLIILTTASAAANAQDPSVLTANSLNIPTAQAVATAPDVQIIAPYALPLTPALAVLTAPNPTLPQQAVLLTQATIAATTPDPTIQAATSAWPNGYIAYRDIVIPPVTGAPANFVMLVSETQQTFRTTANNGRITNANAWDVRFETPGGTKLDHYHVRYDGTVGLVRTFVQVPTTSATANTIVRIYYGKSGLAASEEDVDGTLPSAKFGIRGDTGEDRTSANFDLTPTDVSASTLIGVAGIYSGASVAKRVDASAIDGMTTGTLVSIIQPDPTMIGTSKGWFNVNTPTGTDTASSLGLHFQADGTPGALLIDGRLKTATGNAYAVSEANQQAAAPTVVHFTFQDGQAPKIYINGVDRTAVSTVQSGAISVGAGGAFLGAGPRDAATGGWVGLIDETRLFPSVHSADRCAAEAKSYLHPTQFYGLGGENLAPDATRAPVAPPLIRSATVGEDLDIDVAANGYHPSGSTLTLTGAPTTTFGTVSVASGQIRFRASSTGTGTITYVLAEPGGKTATGYVHISAVEATISADLFQNPFNARAAHHRPIGAGAQYGVPQGITWPDYDAGRRGSSFLQPADATAWATLRARIGEWKCGDTDQGRKGIYRVAAEDTNAADHPTNLQVFRKYRVVSVNNVDNYIFESETQTLRVPPGDTTKGTGGGSGVYYPRNINGGDFTYAFAYRNGDTSPILDMFTDYVGPMDAAWIGRSVVSADPGVTVSVGEMAYTDYGSYRLDQTDTQESPGYSKSAARLRWPGMVLRGFEINDPNPGPIRHCLNVAVTRHSGTTTPTAAQLATQILNKHMVWPAGGIDGSLRTNYGRTDQNQGFLPYGTRLCIKESDRATLRTALAGNARGLVLLDTMIYYGCYIVDGHSQTVNVGGTLKGVMQLRIDGDVGRLADGTEQPAIITDINNALAIMLPYIWPLQNPQLWTALDSEYNAADGLPYAGGGGPLNVAFPERSTNTAYDAGAPAGSLKPLTTWTLAEGAVLGDARAKWTGDTIYHKPRSSGTGGGTNKYGLICSIPMTSFNITSRRLALPGEFDELWLDYYIWWGPDPTGTPPRNFDWESIARTECRPPTRCQISGKFFGLESAGDPYRLPGWNGTGNVGTKLPEGWSTRCSFSGDEYINNVAQPGLAQTYLYDQARSVGSGGRKLKWKKPWPSGPNFQFQKGRRYRCTQYIKINSRTNEAGYSGSQSDGIWRQWIDGDLVYENTGIKFRDDCDHTYRYDSTALTDGNPPVSQYEPSMVAGFVHNQAYEPGAKCRRALISSVNFSNFYGGGSCDAAEYDSYVKVGRFYLWDQPPDFSQALLET